MRMTRRKEEKGNVGKKKQRAGPSNALDVAQQRDELRTLGCAGVCRSEWANR